MQRGTHAGIARTTRQPGRARGFDGTGRLPFTLSAGRFSALFFQILRLTVLLLAPLWLSLGVEVLELRVSLPGPVLDWARKDKNKEFDPSAFPMAGWREAAYLTANPDVAAAVKAGQWRSGYDHYLRFGRTEGRPGTPGSPASVAAKTETAPPPLEPAPTAPLAATALTSPLAPLIAPEAPPVMAAPTPEAGAEEEQLALKPALKPMALPPIPSIKPTPTPSPAASPPTAPIQTPQPQAATTGPIKPSSQTLQVSQIRAATNGGTTRVVLDLNGPPRFTQLGQRAPERVELVLPGTLWRAAPSGAFTGASLTYRIVMANGANHLILGGQGSIQIKSIFALPPEKEHGHRLVIDMAVPVKKRP